PLPVSSEPTEVLKVGRHGTDRERTHRYVATPDQRPERCDRCRMSEGERHLRSRLPDPAAQKRTGTWSNVATGVVPTSGGVYRRTRTTSSARLSSSRRPELRTIHASATSPLDRNHSCTMASRGAGDGHRRPSRAIRMPWGVDDSPGGQVNGKDEMSIISRRFNRTIVAMKRLGIPV